MALTESNMLSLGTQAPPFSLPDVTSGNTLSFEDVKGQKGTVVMFICNHCPFVIHVNEEVVRLAGHYLNKGVGFVAISSNDVENYPIDGPEQMALSAKILKYPFPYLYDETQKVARAYDAACTPDFYVFNSKDSLVYRGRLDASRPGNAEPLTGADLRFALESVLLGQDDIRPQFPSAGCNIKWK